jgi:predicted permease
LRLDLLELTIDRRVVAAAVVAAAVSTILMSGVASLLGFRTTLAAVLRSRSGGTPRLTGRRSRALLVTAQVAVAVVLATGAGLFARSVVKALTINPAFPTDRLITGSLYLDVQGYDVPRADAFFADLRAPLAANPAVEALGFSYSPGSSGGGYPMWIDGEPRDLPSDMPYVGVDDTYFDTIGLRIIQGRDFTSDDRAGAPLVAIVSDSLARFVAPAGDALGHRIRESSRRPGQPYATIEIVGVVPDIIARVSRLEPLVLYRPIAQQNGMPRKILMLRAARDPAEAIREVLAAVKTLDPVVRPRGFATMNQLMLEQMGPQRFGMTVMGALGGIAVLLAVLGAYVLAESMASLRRREMGIRSALGASGLHLRGLVLSETARLVGIGLLAGLVLVWLGSSAIRGFLFQVEPLDPLVIGGVAAAIAVLTLVVSLRPAISAGRVDLAQMLREE